MKHITKSASELSSCVVLSAPNANNTDVILNALLGGETLTVRSVLYRWEILYLPQIVYYLRHHGIPIQAQYCQATRSDGRTVEYAKYFMFADDIATIKGGA